MSNDFAVAHHVWFQTAFFGRTSVLRLHEVIFGHKRISPSKIILSILIFFNLIVLLTFRRTNSYR